MYSQCPECQTRFRVTAEALRAAHGTVRCGRCGCAFDALVRLSDSLSPAAQDQAVPGLAEAEAALAGEPPAVVTAEYHFSADDIEKVFVDARDWQRQFGAEPADTEATEPVAFDAEPPVVVDENERVEDITLEGERIRIESVPGFEHELQDATDRFQTLRPDAESADRGDEWESAESGLLVEPVEEAVGEPFVETATAPVAQAPGETAAEAVGEQARDDSAPPRAASADSSPAPATLAGTPAETTRIASGRWRRDAVEAAVLPDEVLAPASRARRSGGVLAAGSAVLAIVLLGQLTHHFRQDLVRHPRLGPAVRAIYGILGLDLSPNWDLGAFELRQWGNDAAPGTDGRMSVRASLTNRASFAQPHPILRLELEDRFGEPVAVRDFEPREYLKDAAQGGRMVGAGATSEAELVLADPGPEAVGYRLDICLRESEKTLRCTQGRG